MAELSLDILSEVVESCKAGADEAAVAMGRALDAELQLSVGDPGSVDTKALPEGLSGPGLAVVLTVGGGAALVLLSESSGFLPAWYGEPDPTGESKLATLAQELGVCLLPDDYMPDAFTASKVASLDDAVAEHGVADGAALLPLEIQGAGEARATAYLVWPASRAASESDEDAAEQAPQASAAAPSQEAAPEPSAQSPGPPDSVGEPKAGVPQPAQRRVLSARDLPKYTRSLLRIKLPVVVTLARTRQTVGQVTKFGPGSIIQFDKSCEETLELEVGRRTVANGETVKVGDKFGLRITSMILPDERFAPMRKAE